MLPPLPCISLYQPYASLIFAPEPWRKHHETRPWAYPDRLQGCVIAIHATVTRAPLKWLSPSLKRVCMEAFDTDWRETLPRGVILGVARLDGCLSTGLAVPTCEVDRAAGDWSPARFAWRLTDVRKLVEPVPARGLQGLWKVPQDDFRYEEAA